MDSLSLTPPFSSTGNSSTLPNLKPQYALYHHHSNVHNRRIRNGRCKAVLLQEAPLAGAIGACVLNSLISPIPVGPNDNEDGESMIESADARFAVMGIISFIPYFNWMSWVFAWMDTGDKRYVAYAMVYLAPYLSSNLSVLPDESWLPIASILLGILHIQLEASIKNGDLQNFPLFNGKKDEQVLNYYATSQVDLETTKDEQDLPSASDESINKIRSWGMPKKHSRQVQHLDEDGEEGKKE
ncbi:hypothetical protein SSX86_032102 [Deinandra increscens subsp. villosa]|uniref:Uncharacterized protein n=1 Tax=Deinandra increscens subsp. villosa TaxID=3103831 RepID=A0AAP0GH38_9ASTR